MKTRLAATAIALVTLLAGCNDLLGPAPTPILNACGGVKDAQGNCRGLPLTPCKPGKPIPPPPDNCFWPSPKPS
jgi:hypothetical protein